MIRRLTAHLVALVSRAVAVLYPPAFRHRYGEDMCEVLEDLCLCAPGSSITLLRRVTPPLLRMGLGGLSERFIRQPRLSTSPPGPRPARVRGDRFMSSLIRDVAYGVRALATRPAFSLSAIAMLTFGIAANSTVFALFNAAFLRPLPFPEPQRLVDLDEIAPAWGIDYVGISYPDFHAWNELNTTFDSMAVFDLQSANFAADSGADRVSVAFASWQLPTVLGIEPALGRTFRQDDDIEGAERVALLSDATWRDRFDSDPGVLGKEVRLDSQPYTVIGVLPRNAIFPAGTDIWVPLSTIESCCDADEGAGTWWLRGVGRLREGVSLQQARADLGAAHATLVESLGDSRKDSTPRLEPLVQRYLGNSRPRMLVLLGAVAILLLVTCTNIGGLLLARSTARAHEIGVRLALGAGRLRIVRQLLTESLLLAVAGSLAGIVAAHWMLLQVAALIPSQALGWIELRLDARVLGFALVIGVVSTLLFGLAPAVSSSSVSPSAAIRDLETRVAGSKRRGRALSSLVVAEVTLAVVLLVGAGLMIQAFRALSRVDPGFRGDVLTFKISLPETAYPRREDRDPLFLALRDRLAALPWIETAAIVTNPPLGGHTGFFFQAEDSILEEDDTPVVLTRQMTPGYLRTMGIALLDGRSFTAADREPEAELVIVVNETFARTFWGTLDVLDKQVSLGDDQAYRIVGLTHDTKHYGLDQEMRPGVFLPLGREDFGRNTVTYALRGGTDPERLTAPAREVLREMVPEAPIFAVKTMQQALHDSTWPQRLSSLLLGTFAASALILALAGIYSTISYAVAQRHQEIGIRMALGAAQQQVLATVLRDGLRLTAIGLAAGVVLAIGAGSALGSLLAGFRGNDLVTYAGVICLLLLTAAGAIFLPALRAARTNPADALRGD